MNSRSRPGEFARQAEAMASAAAFHSPDVLGRIVRALGPAPAGRVLDLACGPGILMEAIAHLATELVGIDATPEMIALARARLESAGLKGARFQVARAEALPFPAASFDRVVTRLSFHHFPNLPAVLSEIRRVLHPEGRLVAADVVSSPDPEQSRLHNALERLRDPTHVRMLSRAELLAALRSAGLLPIAEESWQQERSFSEWARIVAEPSRTEPLREVMLALARVGVDAGLELHESSGELQFRHTWLLLVARPA